MHLELETVLKRAATGFTAIAVASMLTACGGSSAQDADQFHSTGASTVSADSTAAAPDGGTQTEPKLITLADLPYVDPQPLDQMLAMNDAGFASMLASQWPQVETVLHTYIPPDVDFNFPTPMGFIGPWKSCMTEHSPAACREHMNQLASLMRSKRP